MKKSLICALMAIIGLTLSAAPAGWNWNETDVTKLNALKSKIDPVKEKVYITWTNILIELANKSPKNMTYAEFKAAVQKHKGFVPLMPHVIYRFRSFASDVVKDLDLEKDATYGKNARKYKARYLFAFTPEFNDAKAFRKFYITDKHVFTFKRYANWEWFIKEYEKRMFDFSNEEIKADATLFKKMHYPKIATSEDWKALLVKIELILKSVQ